MLKHFLWISGIVLLAACAQVKAPTGGPKDEEPPRDSVSYPMNGSVNFKVDQITVKFTEFVQLNNLNQKLLVSPLMENPEVSIRGKKMIIKLTDSLRPSTTYTLNFGDAIEDITERNPYENYRYVFSTGSFLDSIRFGGNVYNALTLEPEEGAVVMLYEDDVDSLPRTQRPYYVSKTNKEGAFLIENIRNNNYKIFVLKDNNNNYLFDLPNEPIGFLDATVPLSKDTLGIKLKLFEEDYKKQFLFSYDVKQYGLLKLIFNRPTEKFSIEPMGIGFKKDWFIQDMGVQQDTVDLWLSGFEGKDSLRFKVCDGDYCDTIEFQSWTEELLEKNPLNVKSNTAIPLFPYFREASMTTSAPIKSVNGSSVSLTEDSLPVDISIKQIEGKWKQANVTFDFKEDKSYELTLLPGAIEDIYGRKNDTLKYRYKSSKAEEYGKIQLAVETADSLPYTVDVMMEKVRVRRLKGAGKLNVELENLNPGNYGFYLRVDRNGDGKWTTGNYSRKEQPEQVFRYEGTVEVKANWDQKITWNLAPVTGSK